MRRVGRDPLTVRHDAVDPLAAEADAVSLALAEERWQVPEMTWDETESVAGLLDAWGEQVAPDLSGEGRTAGRSNRARSTAD